METIKVMILEDGMSCEEMNPMGVVPPRRAYASDPRVQDYYDDTVNKDSIEEWRRNNKSLRTFEIRATPIYNEADAIREKTKWIPGSIWNAIIISDGSGQIKPIVEIID